MDNPMKSHSPTFNKIVLGNIMADFNSNLTSFTKQINEYVALLEKKEDVKVENDDSDFERIKVPEPLLLEESEQLTFYPIKNQDYYDMYKLQHKNHWTPEEINLTGDYAQFDKLSTDVKFFICHILAFFAGSDGLVFKNITERITLDIKDTEVLRIYAYQAMMENIHGETYSMLMDTYIPNSILKHQYLNALETIPCIKKKGDWAKKWINSTKSFYHRIIANAVLEGIFFSGAFCAIYWLAEKGILPGLCESNKLIARDESLHTETVYLIYNRLLNRLKESVVHSIVSEAVEIEVEFICVSLPCKLLGMNSDMMSQYIKYVADRLLVSLNYSKKYNATNPFPFMEKIGLQSVSNFFERRAMEYQKGRSGNDHDISDAIESAIKK